MKKFIFIILISVAAHAQSPFALSFFNDDAQIAKLASLQNMQIKEPSVQTTVVEKNLDPRAAFLRSLIVPGWGQHYAGAKLKSELFLGTEIGMWLFYTGFTIQGNSGKENYKAWAKTHAGIDTDGKEKSYYLNIEHYKDIEDFNAAMLRQRNTINYYYDVDANYWNWDSDDNWEKFGDLRKGADRAFNHATLTLGLVMANHIVSAIDAIFAVKKHNQNELSSIDWDVQFGNGIYQPYVNLSFSKQF